MIIIIYNGDNKKILSILTSHSAVSLETAKNMFPGHRNVRIITAEDGSDLKKIIKDIKTGKNKNSYIAKKKSPPPIIQPKTQNVPIMKNGDKLICSNHRVINHNLNFHRENPALYRMHKESAYFSALKCLDNKIRIYFRLHGPFDGQNGYAAMIESNDGIDFSQPKNLLKRFKCHNFFPFIDKNPKSNEKYRCVARNISHICDFSSANAINWEMKNPHLISSSHNGITSGRTHGGEFDGHLCCFWNEHLKQYILYARANYKKGVRHIQYATSKDFIVWSPFNLINIQSNFDFNKDNYYFPAFWPMRKGFMGIAVFNNSSFACFDLMVSPDGINWKIIHSFFPSKTWRQWGSYRAKNHPAIGLVESVDKKQYYFYAHENYMKNKHGVPINLMRYSTDKQTLDDEIDLALKKF